MAGNAGLGNSGAGAGAATVTAAGNAIASADTTRFQPRPSHHRRSRWAGCLGGLSCFGAQKGGKRIVPAARTPGGSAATPNAHPNGAHQGGGGAAASNGQNAPLNLSLLAPPSSPASFTNSALPSTAQSPSCFLSISANSPGGPSSMMFATGPYAHETQLVSPPVFSTFTTEPSTAPLTPPPELAQLTTPSSPDVPFARFLSSSMDLRTAAKVVNGVPFSDLQLQGNYHPLYIPGSPSSSLISPASATPRTGLSSPLPEQEGGLGLVHPVHWTSGGSALSSGRGSPYSRNNVSSKLFGLDSAPPRNFILDQAQQSSLPVSAYGKGRPSLSREADASPYSNMNGNNTNINGGHCKNGKQDVEEIEAYRASFGFSADEIITMQNYAGPSDVPDDSFTMCPFPNGGNPCTEGEDDHSMPAAPAESAANAGPKMEKTPSLKRIAAPRDALPDGGGPHCKGGLDCTTYPTASTDVHPFVRHKEESSLLKKQDPQISKRVRPGQSCSDAEVEYRRARSLRETSGILAWRNSLP